jgi:hypothetical protein
LAHVYVVRMPVYDVSRASGTAVYGGLVNLLERQSRRPGAVSAG